jgi:hypothetical protein
LQTQQQRHVVIFPPGTVSDRQTSTIHALLLDESVNVAPHVPGGCTVAHFTTTVAALDTSDVAHVVLKGALDFIIASTEQSSTVEEVFHTSFSYDLWSNESDSDGTWSDVDGLHVMNRPRPRLSADEAFDQAAAIFAKICPGQDFLKLSKEMGDAVKASLGEHAFDVEDEEKTVLDSAVADL